MCVCVCVCVRKESERGVFETVTCDWPVVCADPDHNAIRLFL